MRSQIKNDIDELITLAYNDISLINDKLMNSQIVNDLEIGGVDSPISAEQGKELKYKLELLDNTIRQFKLELADIVSQNGISASPNDNIDSIVNNINNIPPPSGDVIRPIIFEVTTTEPNSVFTFPVYGPHNVFIDWGDGNIEKIPTDGTYAVTNKMHTYTNPGIYRITIDGTCNYFKYDTDVRGRDLITKVIQIGDVPKTLEYAFFYCNNLSDISELRLFKNHIVNASFMFAGCVSITSIPQDIIRGSNIAMIGGMFSGCIKLLEIPPFFFDGMNVCTWLGGVFDGCKSIKSLPADLFNGCIGFDGGLMDNTGITTLDENLFRGFLGSSLNNMFKGWASLTAIPPNLITNTNVKTINYMFANCTSLTSIPPGMFSGLTITESEGLFAGCTNITTLPADLFSGCVNFVGSYTHTWVDDSAISIIDENIFRGYLGTSAYCMFIGCTQITSVPPNILSGTNITNVKHMFADCINITSNLPEFWNLTDRTWVDRGWCFRGCTKAPNYASVPGGWK